MGLSYPHTLIGLFIFSSILSFSQDSNNNNDTEYVEEKTRNYKELVSLNQYKNSAIIRCSKFSKKITERLQGTLWVQEFYTTNFAPLNDDEKSSRYSYPKIRSFLNKMLFYKDSNAEYGLRGSFSSRFLTDLKGNTPAIKKQANKINENLAYLDQCKGMPTIDVTDTKGLSFISDFVSEANQRF